MAVISEPATRTDDWAARVASHVEDLSRRQQDTWPDEVPRSATYPLGEIGVTDYVRARAKKHPDRAAIEFYGTTVTYGELDDLSDRVVTWLRSSGVQPGDRVGVSLPNCPQFIILMIGILKMGAIHVPINPMFKDGELEHELDDAGIGLVVTAEDMADRIERIKGSDTTKVQAVAVEDLLPESPALPWPSPLPERQERGVSPGWREIVEGPRANSVDCDLDAVAVLNYTGGTTGLPKGCKHTQRNMIYAAANCANSWGFPESESPIQVALSYTPIFWISGENTGILVPLVKGATVVLLTRWDAETVLQAIELYGVTAMNGTVDNYIELMDHPSFPARSLSTLRFGRAMSFVQKLSPQIRARWQRALGASAELREGSYGMTESHTANTFTRGLDAEDNDLLREPVFCGLPVPGTAFMIVDSETRLPMPIGQAGEIALRSPSLFTGYWQAEPATMACTRDGWLFTGDTGRISEDGCLHYLGRRKEMIKVNGMSVFPSEVEVLMARHPDIEVAAVLPVDDPKVGQRPYAFIQPVKGVHLDAEAVTEWARGQMAPYKVPLIQIDTSLPVTSTGKINKKLLRAPEVTR